MNRQRWFLPTNTENLELFLSNGLILCSNGLGNAYLTDIMERTPKGYIPFFSQDNLSCAIEYSSIEDENLITCIVELDYTQILTFSIYAQDNNFQVTNDKNDYFKLNRADLSEGIIYDHILLPSPLPLQCIKHVIFESKVTCTKQTKFFEALIAFYPPKFFTFEAKLFKRVSTSGQLETSVEKSNESIEKFNIEDKTIDYKKIFSLGGMLSLMFYQTKNGRSSIDFFNQACKLSVSLEPVHNEFNIFNNYFHGEITEDLSYDSLCGGLFQLISNDNGSISEVRASIFSYLKGIKTDEKVFSIKMATRLEEINDRTLGKPPEQVFEELMELYNSNLNENKQNKKIIMILVMYFFRDNIQTMLKFYHEKFSEIDYILFSMFYGAENKYINLPSEIKGIKGLSFFISNRMAEYYHLKMTGISSPIFKKVAPPKFIIGNLIAEKSKGEQDKFTNWFFDFCKLDYSKFQSWKLEDNGEGFTCETDSVLSFDEVPAVTLTTNILNENIVFDDSKDENEVSKWPNMIKALIDKYKCWNIANKKFKCNSSSRKKLKLNFNEKPDVTTLIKQPEFERQLLENTIGNEKDLFNYNEVYKQYEKLVK